MKEEKAKKEAAEAEAALPEEERKVLENKREAEDLKA